MERRVQRGIQSIEVGGRLLQALVHHGGPLPLKDLAAAAGMPPAQAHAYLVSFGKLGLVEQEGASGRYGLGPLAMQVGLISLQQYDPVALATPVVEALAIALAHTTALAVWGNRGATIVHVARPPTLVQVSMRHGTVLSLSRTASGRVFGAWLPEATVLPVLRAEAAEEGRAWRAAKAAWAATSAAVRAAGFADAVDLAQPGVSALAAPVFEASGLVVAALTAIGPTAGFDTGARGPLAPVLVRAAGELSARLGHAGGAADPAGVQR
jgi:DNA-binding IclR family transcriptional regulator